MVQTATVSLNDIACCPRCHAALDLEPALPRCTNADCAFATVGFPRIGTQPVLIDFDNSIFDRAAFGASHQSVLARDDSGRGFRVRLRSFIAGRNRVAAGRSEIMLETLKRKSGRPVILVIGGGALGAGAEALYADPGVSVIGTDVYASVNTAAVADGHRLPFHDGVFDAVWIQAVLEHVLEPQKVADEIWRVLKPEGLVYAETPFMQQVHEAAFDFTRFTQSGHRWLFRRFAEIDAGVVNGASVSLVWAVRYLYRALGASDKLSTVLTLPFFWVRFLEGVTRGRADSDAASGVFFYGTRSETAIGPKDMPAYYEAQRRPRRASA